MKALSHSPLQRMARALWLLLALGAACLAGPAQALRIKEVAAVQGVRSNQLTGYGLIVGLEKNVAPAGYESLGIHAPFTRSKFNFVMQTATNADEALPLTRMERVTTST